MFTIPALITRSCSGVLGRLRLPSSPLRRSASHQPPSSCSSAVVDDATLAEPRQQQVTYESQGNLAIICIANPAARNAIGSPLSRRLAEAFERFDRDADARVAVLYGLGGAFSTGTDMKSAALVPDIEAERKSSAAVPAHFRKPVVCGVGGYCVGSGLELALRCDLRVVEEDATLGFFNRRYGVPLADVRSAGRLAALVGGSRAADLLLSGRAIGGKEALEMGVANRVVATGTSLGQAVTLAKSIAKYPQASLLFDRDALYRSISGTVSETNFNGLSEDIRAEIEHGAEMFKSSRGPAGKTQNIKRNEMADWELAEYHIEQQRLRK